MNNYHLIIVHFPIALLVVYTFFEILNLFIARDWNEMKMWIVSLGAIGAVVSRITGEWASEIHSGAYIRKTLELHESVSALATGVFIFISVIYILNFLIKNNKIIDKVKNLLGMKLGEQLFRVINKFLEIFYTKWFLTLLAIFGFVAIALTGTLGGILAHGCQTDPMTNIVCNLFTLN